MTIPTKNEHGVYFHGLPIIQTFLLVCFFYLPSSFLMVHPSQRLYLQIIYSLECSPLLYVIPIYLFQTLLLLRKIKSDGSVMDITAGLEIESKILRVRTMQFYVDSYKCFLHSLQAQVFRIISKLKHSHTVYFIIKVINYSLYQDTHKY